jgi:hypothetical protein
MFCKPDDEGYSDWEVLAAVSTVWLLSKRGYYISLFSMTLSCLGDLVDADLKITHP